MKLIPVNGGWLDISEIKSINYYDENYFQDGGTISGTKDPNLATSGPNYNKQITIYPSQEFYIIKLHNNNNLVVIPQDDNHNKSLRKLFNKISIL